MAVILADPRGYGKAKPGSSYAGVGERTFRGWLKEGLPHYRLPSGTILVAYRDIDQWLQKFKVEDRSSHIDELVEEITQEMMSN